MSFHPMSKGPSTAVHGVFVTSQVATCVGLFLGFPFCPVDGRGRGGGGEGGMGEREEGKGKERRRGERLGANHTINSPITLFCFA